ncbi:hypothetical protein [Ventosimonas gracilis]|nr:hypothetical protein [Ventosimonas gracilis]
MKHKQVRVSMSIEVIGLRNFVDVFLIRKIASTQQCILSVA